MPDLADSLDNQSTPSRERSNSTGDQSIDQSPDQSINPSISQSNPVNSLHDQSHQSINQLQPLESDPLLISWTVEPTAQPISQSSNQSIDQSSDPSIIQSNPSIAQPNKDDHIDSPVNENQSINFQSNQSIIDQSIINQSINHMSNQSINDHSLIDQPDQSINDQSFIVQPNQSMNDQSDLNQNLVARNEAIDDTLDILILANSLNTANTGKSINQSINQTVNPSPNQSINNVISDKSMSPVNSATPIPNARVNTGTSINSVNSNSSVKSINCGKSIYPLSLADVIDRAGPSIDMNRLIDPLPQNRSTVNNIEHSAAAVVFNNQSIDAGQNPLQSSTNASQIMSKMLSNNQSVHHTRHKRNSSNQSTSQSQSSASDTDTITVINRPVAHYCHRLIDSFRSAYAYLCSFDPWLVFILLISTLAAVLLYIFNCRDILHRDRDCIMWLWGNPLYKWFAMVAILVACYQLACIAESILLAVFLETSGTRFWRIGLYGSAIEWSGRHLAYFSALLTFRQQRVFLLIENVSAIVDPLLSVFVMALSLQIVKNMILKHIVWKMNQTAFDAKIEQLFFVVDFINVISDCVNMMASEQIGSGRTDQSINQSIDDPRKPDSYQKNYADLLTSVKNWTLGQTQAREVLRNTKIAHEAGKALWRQVDVSHRGYVTLIDYQCWLPIDKACRAFYLCLPPDKRCQVNPAAGLHEHDESDLHSDSGLFPRASAPYSAITLPPSQLMPFLLTKQEFISAIVQFATDRRKLSLEMTDWSNMSDILSSIGTLIWILCCIFILIAMYSSFSTADLKPMTTLVLAWAFMFGNSAKVLMEAMVFILVAKPFSLGDRIYVPTHSSSDLIVHNIALLSTTFKDALTNKIVAIPNSVLANQELQNLTRSKQPCFEIPIELDLDVTSEQLTQLQQSLVHWMRNGEQKGNWMDRVALNMTKDALWLKDRKLKMVIRVSHTKTWNDVTKLRNSLRELIQYITQTTKDMNIRPKK